MPGSAPGPASQASFRDGRLVYVDPVLDPADFAGLPASSPGAAMLAGPAWAAAHPVPPAPTAPVIPLPVPPGTTGRLVRLPGGRMGVTPANLQRAMGPAEVAPPVNFDPPPGTNVIQDMPDGTLVVTPLPAGFNGDDAGQINTALLQSVSNTPVGIVASPTNRGGKVILGPGVFQAKSGIVANAVAPQYLEGAGLGATYIAFTGTGDAIRMFDNYIPTGGALSIRSWGGGVSKLTVDVSGAGLNAVGLHIGDMKGSYFSQVQVQHANSGTGVGVWVDNTLFWTEDVIGEFHILDCNQAVVFDMNSSYSGAPSGSGSVNIDNNVWTFNIGGQGTGQSGILVTGGAFIYHSRIYLHGGMRSSSVAHTNWCALRVGNNFGANDGSAIFHCELIFQMESDGAGANTPQTIIQAHAGNNINGCWGYMNFMSGYAAGSTPAQFIFMGPIHGDSTLTAPSMSGIPAAGAGAGPQQTNNGPATNVVVSGGTGVNISIDGTSTGLATGIFLIESGHTFGLGNYTVAPAVTYLSAIPGT